MQSMGDVAGFSAALRVLAIDLSKIASDLRLMVMGPRTGIDEIKLPAVQPGSSIMPGKINPSIPEMVNQVCFQVMGLRHDRRDRRRARAARAQRHDAGHRVQRAALDAHPHQCGDASSPSSCVVGIEANEEHVRVLGRALGGAGHGAHAAHRLREGGGAQQAVGEGGSAVRDMVKRDKLLPADEIDEVLDLRKMTEIGVPGGKHGMVARAAEPYPDPRARIRLPTCASPLRPNTDSSVRCTWPVASTTGR